MIILELSRIILATFLESWLIAIPIMDNKTSKHIG